MNLDPECGSPCVGPRTESRSCGRARTPARWGAYGPWSSCSVSCGAGTQTRTRSCANVDPECGTPCVGPRTESRSCGRIGDMRPGMWETYGAWSTCTKVKGCGVQSRTRVCRRGPCGAPCSGDATEKRHCGIPVEPGKLQSVSPCQAVAGKNPVTCLDYKVECPYWATAGYCSSPVHLNYMKTMCCNSCGGRGVSAARLAEHKAKIVDDGQPMKASNARPMRPARMIPAGKPPTLMKFQK